jgi:hypothetical protein
MQPPRIETAIPKQRYQFGPYQAVLLGEITSPDPVRYQFILALVRQGEAKPGFFVTSEKNPRARNREGTHRMRVISEESSEDLGSSDRYADADAFAAEALAAASRVLGLVGIEPVRLM